MEWKSEEGGVGLSPLKKMIEVRRASHKNEGYDLEEESGGEFKLK